jgi:hypothetical protein
MTTPVQFVATGFNILSKLPENQQEELIDIAKFLLRQQELEADRDSHELELERRKAAMAPYSALLEQIRSLKSPQ